LHLIYTSSLNSGTRRHRLAYYLKTGHTIPSNLLRTKHCCYS
jgi:hypothetical protein